MSRVVSENNGLHDEDKLRADLYGFLARLLLGPPSAPMLDEIKTLTGDTSDLGQAFVLLASMAKSTQTELVKREYEDLFIGIGRGELLPYGSYYLTGFLNEKPLAKLRNDLRELGIERKDNVKEPEDHIGTLMEVMEGLIIGNFGDAERGSAEDLAIQKKFYRDHIENWAPHFFKDLEKAISVGFYQPIGTIGKLFLDIESAAFAME